MAGSSRLHDSRLSLVRVHIPLPAVRPRQRSWGTSLPQSVIWIFGHLTITVLACPAKACHKERRARLRNGLGFGLRGHLLTVGPERHPGPLIADFPALLTHFRLQSTGRGANRRAACRLTVWGPVRRYPPPPWPKGPSVISLPAAPFLPPSKVGDPVAQG